jgi:general stress protein 26
MDLENIRLAGLHLMQTAENIYLVTSGSTGYPDIRSVFNLRNTQKYPTFEHHFRQHDRDFMVLIGTNTSSIKVRELRADPRASLYYCLPDQLHGMMLCGEFEILQDDELRRNLWLDNWIMYYPQGYTDPDYAVLRMFPKFAKGWYRARPFDFTF